MKLFSRLKRTAADIRGYETEIGRLCRQIDVEMRRGREVFELEVVASRFPKGNDEDFDAMPLLVEDALVKRRPVTVVKLDHQPGADHSTFTLRVKRETAEPDPATT